MKRLAAAFVALLALAGCRNNQFTIEGTISGATDSTLVYFEQLTLGQPRMIDSARVDRQGRFRFREQRPDYPDLYQVRIGHRAFVFPIDSTERVSVEAHADSMSAPRQIEGSPAARQLQQLRNAVRSLQTEYDRIGNGVEADSVVAHLNRHKTETGKLILTDPKSVVAYYAIFQQLAGYYIFSPFDKADRPYCAAVATAYHTYMPEYYRSKNLYTLVMTAIGQERRKANEQRLNDIIEQAESGFLDIELPNYRGEKKRLSDLKGKVVLIDFTAFTAKESPAYTLYLRGLYGKYHDRGLEIYQVSGDAEESFWRQSVASLPWVSVYDRDASSHRTYNVEQLPTHFLMDRGGVVVSRDVPMDQLEAAIEQLL